MSNAYTTEPPTSGKILMKTTAGDIEIELWGKEIPKACRNFVQLCMEGYYNDSIFHRVVPNFIVQGGDPSGTGAGGESAFGAPFDDEFHSRIRFSHRGLIAMASTGRDTNASQFFFTLDKAEELSKKHTIFGKVVGDTIFNLLKIGEAELAMNSERPLFPVRILETIVLADPFEDIVPRTTPEQRKHDRQLELEKAALLSSSSLSSSKVQKLKIKKNLKLLSFEDDEDAEDTNDTPHEAKRIKIKSSHDVLENDPHLSNKPVEIQLIDDLSDDDLITDNASSRMHNDTSQLPSLRGGFFIKEKQAKLSILKSEIALVQAAIVKSRKAPVAKKVRLKKQSLVEEMRAQYTSKRSTIIADRRGKKVVANEDDLLGTLQGFKDRLGDVGTKSATLLDRKKVAKVCAVHQWEDCESCSRDVNAGDDDDDDIEGWRTHELVFRKDKANVYEPKLDDYSFIDPRAELLSERFEYSRRNGV